MLQEKTVEPRTLALLKKLMNDKQLNQFALAWGTNLALRYGYRISIDLDFFSDHWFDGTVLAEYISENYDHVIIRRAEENALICLIEDIKVDFITQKNINLCPRDEIQWVRLYSVPDICAMKFAAIQGRWVKKDYRDIAHLFAYYNFTQMCNFFSRRYPRVDVWVIYILILSFSEIKKDPSEIIPLDTITRPKVKKIIKQAVEEHVERKRRWE